MIDPLSPEHFAAIGVAVVASGLIVRRCLARHRKFQAVRRAVAARRAEAREDHIVIRLRGGPPMTSRLPNIDSTYENDDWIHNLPKQQAPPEAPAPEGAPPAAPQAPPPEPPPTTAGPEHRARWQDKRPTWRELTRDQKGAETLEWAAVAAVMVATALLVYAVPGGNVITGLNDAAYKLRLLLVGLVP